MTGSFWEAAVEGLRSWVGDGLRFMEAVWMVSAIWRGIEESILFDVVVWLGFGILGRRAWNMKLGECR